MVNIKTGIYVDLDSLMDTRLSTLSSIDKQLAYELLSNGSYIDRLYDEFGYINHHLFKEFYDRRNKITLLRSFPTKIVELIATELILMESKQIEANEIPLLTLTVNTYPYTLTDKEMKSFTHALKLHTLNKKLQVAYINIPPTSLTLDFISIHFSVVIMYDYSRWIDYHLSIKSGNAVDTILYVPGVLGNAVKIKKIKDIEDMFDAYSELFGAFINIKHIPVESYCIQEKRKEDMLKLLKS
jgi:hypothetical protein